MSGQGVTEPPALGPAETAAVSPHRPAGRTLSQDLQAVLDHAAGGPLSLGEVVDAIGQRGMALMLMIVCIPFLVPIPTMGLSAPAGLAVASYGVTIMLNVRPWLPKFLARRQLSYGTLQRVVGVGLRLTHRAERLLKPRLKFMTWPGINALIGVSLVLLGLFLSLPLPIPGTNAAPAVGILLLLAGWVERDGVFVLAGQLCAAVLLGGAGVVAYLVAVYGWAGFKAMVGWGAEPARSPATAPATMPGA